MCLDNVYSCLVGKCVLMFAWKTCTHVCLVPYIVEYGSVSLVEFLHTP